MTKKPVANNPFGGGSNAFSGANPFGSGGGDLLKSRAERDEDERDLGDRPVVLDHNGEELPIEVDTKAELNEYREAAKRAEARLAYINDGNYYSVVVFPTREHRDAFLRNVHPRVWDEAVHAEYVDGVRLAKLLDVEIPPLPNVPNQNTRTRAWDMLGYLPEDGL